MNNLQEMSEEDIKLKFITPQILSKGWSVDDISMEKKVKLTDGKINLQGNIVVRGRAKYADYVLYYNRATPIAIVEAKDAGHSVSYGLQQLLLSVKMRVHPFSRRMLLLIPLTLLAWGADSLLPRVSSVWIDLFLRSAVVGVVLLVLLLLMRITPELMGMLEGRLPARFKK